MLVLLMDIEKHPTCQADVMVTDTLLVNTSYVLEELSIHRATCLHRQIVAPYSGSYLGLGHELFEVFVHNDRLSIRSVSTQRACCLVKGCTRETLLLFILVFDFTFAQYFLNLCFFIFISNRSTICIHLEKIFIILISIRIHIILSMLGVIDILSRNSVI